MSQPPTPETDRLYRDYVRKRSPVPANIWIMYDHACKLERERNLARSEISALRRMADTGVEDFAAAANSTAAFFKSLDKSPQ